MNIDKDLLRLIHYAARRETSFLTLPLIGHAPILISLAVLDGLYTLSESLAAAENEYGPATPIPKELTFFPSSLGITLDEEDLKSDEQEIVVSPTGVALRMFSASRISQYAFPPPHKKPAYKP